MPPLHPCGLAVDWVRSCFKGFWRFFGDTDELTVGRLYFLPPETPHYDVPHYFGSDYWRRGDVNWPFALGHISRIGGQYSDGAQIPLRPLRPAPNVGLETPPGGFSLPVRPDPEIDELGIAAQCYVPLPVRPQSPLPPPLFPRISLDWVDSCCFWVLACKLIDLTYDEAWATIGTTLVRWLGPGEFVRSRRNPLLDPLFIYRNPTGNLICLAGTTTGAELLAEFMWGAAVPQNFGSYTAHYVFNQYATFVERILVQIGIDLTLPTIIIGHSAGAATGVVLAAKLREANETRPIGVVTVACPRPGGQSLIELYRPVRQTNLVFEDDPVPGLPLNIVPSPPGFGFIVGQIVGNAIRFMRTEDARFQDLPHYDYIRKRGQMDRQPAITWDHIQRILRFVANPPPRGRHAPIPRESAHVARLIRDHSVANYFGRLRLICCPRPTFDFREAFRWLDISIPASISLVPDDQFRYTSIDVNVVARADLFVSDDDPDGGVEIGGQSIPPQAAAGGVEVGGASALPTTSPGGVEIGGRSALSRRGVEIGGSGVAGESSGGVEIGGAGVAGASSGGVDIGGSDVPPAANGGIEMGG